MYERHFGLTKRPFRANATGTDVFVGPHIATTMAGVKKALSNSDAIVVVSGPVGSGKTTLVNRALESLSTPSKIVNIARIRLNIDDVLEYLLDELGIEKKPRGTIQKFGVFRRFLKEFEDNGMRVFVAIEDAVRLGADTLAEIEALTAADAGESEGASVILMGNEDLAETLQDKQLARLQQRIRQKFTVATLPAAELRGYLRHCFRLAGGEFERVFEANAANLLHHLGHGVPRVTNNLVESAMRTAEDQGLNEVPSALLARIAENEYGLSATDFDITPVTVFAETETDLTDNSGNEIPELIQDTLPDLAILAPGLAAGSVAPVAGETEPEVLPELIIEPEAVAEIIPELNPLPLLQPEPEREDIPDWDRDSTLLELRPDLDALEQAMAFAKGDGPEPAPIGSEPAPVQVAEQPEVIPEITLDNAISQRFDNNLIDEPGEISAPAAAAPADGGELPAINLPKKQTKKADAELEKISTELAKAKSLEDMNDKLAETLFGEELNFIAAQVLANPPNTESANDDMELVANAQVAPGQPVATGSNPSFEITLEAPKQLGDGGMALSATQRLKTVRALNADLYHSIREPESTAASRPKGAPAELHESIEDQMNTSMTQTLKALNVTPPVIDADGDDEELRGGFFNRFRRS